jgi:hypothetical protein
MTLRIGKLSTRCLVPRGQEEAGGLVDAIARHVLPRELLERFGPSLDRQAAVVRLRRLNCTVRIELAELTRGGLAAAWADALARALHQALARPDQDGETLRRFESRASYIAAMIVATARGPPERRSWQFPELGSEAGRHPALVVLDLFLGSGSLLGRVLEELRRAGDLAKVLALLDEVGLERVVCAVAEVEGASALSAAQLVTVASALVAMGVSPARGEAATRRRAIELWLHLRREMPLRGIWYGMKLLLHFLEEPALLTISGAPGQRPADSGFAASGTLTNRGSHAVVLPPSLAEIMSRFPEWCERLRRQLASEMPVGAASGLEELRQITPSAAPSRRNAGPLWQRLDFAGLLLLLPVIRRLGWPRLYRDPGFGPRVFQALVAGAAMRLVQPWTPGDKIEPAAGLLAGMLGEAERLGLAQVLASTRPVALGLFPDAQGWPEALDAVADALARGLAVRIRGFRDAGRSSIVHHFLRVPGRVLADEKDVRIVLEPSPWSVVLHVSGADDALDSVEWLRDRRVVYVLEGV